MDDNPFRDSEWPESRPSDGGPLFIYLLLVGAIMLAVAALHAMLGE